MTHSASLSNAFPQYRTRQTAQPSQPRYIVAKRLNSVRLNWFMFGMLGGMTLCFAFNMMFGGLMNGGIASPIVRTATLSIEVDTPETTTQSVASSIMQVFSSSEDEPELAAKAEDAPKQQALIESEPKDPSVINHTLKSGETLANILVNNSIDYAHAHKAIERLRKQYDPRGLRAGQKIELKLGKAPDGTAVLDELRIQTSPIKSVLLTRSGDENFAVKTDEKSLEPKLTLAGGTITNSLFETGYANGIPDGVLAELMNAYSYDVDFQREIQRGDQVQVLFEKMFTEDGDEAGYGDIVYANLKIRGKPLSIYRYESKDGFAGFYNDKGESVIKALLKTPVSGARISSGFGKRRHPILGYTKMHKGTDFAAATGTPIYAAGDATISFAGRKGGYGNYIKLKHNGTYSTAYAHMHKFAKGMRTGKKVKQGQVIGYVGTTGRSTGPHLHYEVHKNGAQVNPMREKFKTGKVLKGTELANFKASMSKIKNQVASMPHSTRTVASAQ